MIYTAGLEINDFNQQWNGRSILLSEGDLYIYVFNENNPFIIYLYYVSNPSKNLILNFNLINKKYFDVNFYISKKKRCNNSNNL